MARNLSAKKRREIKKRKVLEHQQQIDGKLPVFEYTLRQSSDGSMLHRELVYVAPRQPIVPGYPEHSQTAKVMKALETYGAQFARL